MQVRVYSQTAGLWAEHPQRWRAAPCAWRWRV